MIGSPRGGRRPAGKRLAIATEIAVEAGGWASDAELDAIVARVLAAATDELRLSGGPTELSLLFTDDAHIRALNRDWRRKDKATNVLSFPAFPDASADAIPPMLGDIAIAHETVAREAGLDAKPFDHHLTHLILHGLLHLLGYDHEEEGEAEEMEAVERRVLAALAIPDPYGVIDEDN